MDQALLVVDQIDEGRRLLEFLNQSGFDISAAFWIRSEDDGRWSLNFVTTELDHLGVIESYMAMLNATKQVAGLNLKLGQVTLLRPGDPLAMAFVDFIGEHPEYLAMRLWGTFVGKYPIDEAYIYPHAVTA